MKSAIAAVLAAALSACGYDPGGDVDEYIAAAERARRTGQTVRIVGGCDSACIIKLGSGKVCVSPYASFGVHEARIIRGKQLYAEGIRSEEGTQKMRAAIPTCARRLFDSAGAFDTPHIIGFGGDELLAACAGILTRCENPLAVLDWLVSKTRTPDG